MSGAPPSKQSEYDQLIYVLSHDLRAPARALRQYAMLLKDECAAGLSDNGKRFLGRMDLVLDKLDERLDAILRLSRLGNPTGPFVPIDVAALAAKGLAERGLSGEVAPDLPKVVADAERIELVLAAVLDNVVHHAGDGARVTVGHEQGRFFVRDNGKGIPEHLKDEVLMVFRPVPYADSPRRGLGLTFASRVARSLGGKVEVESAPGQGTTVWLTLPTISLPDPA